MPASRQLIVLGCALLVCTSAGAEPAANPCAECGPLPAGYLIDVEACTPASPTLYGEPGPARPTSIGVGRMLARTPDEGAFPRLWLGVDDRGIAYAAIFDRAPGAASSCLTLGAVSGARSFSATTEPTSDDRPMVTFSARAVWDDARCMTREERFHVARLADGRWELLAKVPTCRREEHEQFRKQVALRLEGVEALKKGNLELAIELLRRALPEVNSAAVLAGVKIQQGSLAEAERLLTYVLSAGGPRIPTFSALEQLFTRAKQPGFALEFHQRYLEALAKNATRSSEPREPEGRYRFCTDETVKGEALPEADKSSPVP